jgi:hypothetical protein
VSSDPARLTNILTEDFLEGYSWDISRWTTGTITQILLRQQCCASVSVFTIWLPEFVPWSNEVGFLVNKVALWVDFLVLLPFPLPFIPKVCFASGDDNDGGDDDDDDDDDDDVGWRIKLNTIVKFVVK